MTNRTHPPTTPTAIIDVLSGPALATTRTSDNPLAPVLALAPMPTSPETLPVEIDEAQAIYALQMAGFTPYQIALRQTEKTGRKWSSKDVTDAIATVAEANVARTAEQMTYAAQLDLDRIDAMIQVLWPQVQNGNLLAIDRATVLMRRRAELLGLDAPDVRLSLSLGSRDAVDLESLTTEELQTYRDLQRKAASAARSKVVRGRVT